MVLMSGVTAAHALFEDLGMNVPAPQIGSGFEGPKRAAGEFIESKPAPTPQPA